MLRPVTASGSHSNASSASLGNRGAPMHAMMVPGVIVPTMERPDPTSPFSDWEAYIVKQAQTWSDKRAQPSPSFPPQSKNHGPRIAWADQVRKPPSQTQPLTYTKARDRFAQPPVPQDPSSPSSHGLFHRPSRYNINVEHSTPPPSTSSVGDPNISSPIITSPIPLAAQLSLAAPLPAPVHTATSAADAPHSRAFAEPLQVPRNVESTASSIRSLSSLPLSLSSGDFSASLLIDFDKRDSLISNSSSRAPGPSDLLATSLSALLDSQSRAPPSIASTYSMQSRRSSWASSIDLDPAIICTPPLSTEGWQEQPQPGRPDFLAEYGLDHDTEESDTECSHYPDEHEALSSLPSLSMSPPKTPQDHELPSQSVFQRLEADLISLSGNDDNNSQRLTPDGRPLPSLEIASLPREKEEMVRKARARILSPTSFKKAFSLKPKGSNPGSASLGSRSNDSSPSLVNSSSEEVGKISETPIQTPTTASMRPDLPSFVTEDMTQWAAGVPPVAPPASAAPHAPAMQLSPSIDSSAHTPSSAHSSAETPLSPSFSNSAASFVSRSSHECPSSIGSFGQRKHRVGTPGLTKKSAADASIATPTLDPHLARVQTRARSTGSISSQTPSVTLSATSSNRRPRTSRKSGRSRITDGMPSFANIASTLAVPASQQRRLSNRSVSSEGSVDNHSNASNASSYAKVGGSSDDGMPPLSPSPSSNSATPVFKSVLRKRVPSEDFSLLSPKKEVSFDLPSPAGFDAVDEARGEEEEILEHEQRQRSHLKLPPMKLQLKQSAATTDDALAAVPESSKRVTLDDFHIIHFLSTFGRDLKIVESLEVLDNMHADSDDWPKRQDWDSLPGYLVAYVTTLLSRFADDSATLVYSDERAPISKANRTVSAPLLSSHPWYTSTVRSILRIASWEQPLVSASVSSFYALSIVKGKLAAVVLLACLAFLVTTQAAQSDSCSNDAEELSEAYSKIASVLFGSASTHERMRNLVLWRSPKASLRLTGLLLALAAGATRFGSGLIMSLPGLLIGLALFVWLPAIVRQPKWAPTWLKQGNPLDVLLYDVPTNAQHAILTLRRRAASGEQLIRRPASEDKLASLSTTSFDHRVSAQELQHVSDVIDGAYFGVHDNEAGHLIVLASRIIFRTLASKSDEPISFTKELASASTGNGCKIAFDARLEKVVCLQKTQRGLEVRLKNGQKVQFDQMEGRDEAFARIVALAPQKWH